ncbi:unnamed protein product [Rhizophagus irregularis]|nr:unnamed protein product [Rhizophagus irregularis]CAB5357127.1 unnamed protein product [Rhizophagus irregularis]
MLKNIFSKELESNHRCYKLDSNLNEIYRNWLDINLYDISSGSLNSYISRCSSINFSSNDYTSKELELDIDIESGLNSLGIKRNIEELNINSCENNGKRSSDYSRTFSHISQRTIMKK